MTKLKLFGTDGIRGRANSSKMNSEMAMAVGRAVAYFARKNGGLPQIVIGKDTRQSGYMLETALSTGITSMGLDVLKTGPLPTPGVGFICQSMRARMGIVISASHNPVDENGIKLFGNDGFKLSIKDETEIEKIIFGKVAEKRLAPPDKIGKITQLHDAAGRYIQFLKGRFPHRLNLNGLRIAIDAANGAAYSVAPSVFSELGAEVATINDYPNGKNINLNCGALYPEHICKFTKRIGADIGISLDGDGDRLILSDEKGDVVDGDGILYICAKHLHSRGNLGQSTVVGTIVTNYGLDSALKKEGISLVRTEVGDHNVVDYMRKNGINLGGESSGHLIYLHHHPSGDGILAALRILSIIQQTQTSLSHLVKDYKPFPQETVNVPVKKKVEFDSISRIAKARKAAEKELNGNGRVVLRYSGTQKIARVMVESKSQKTTLKIAKHLAGVVKKELGIN